MGHGLGAVREMRLYAYAERFQAAGYACLVFDYRHFGASGGEPRQLLIINRQLADWAAAIAFARSLPEFDPAQVVLWGSSFGGGHVIAAAARDGKVAAVISQCPFTDGIASALVMNPFSSLKLAVLAGRDVLAGLLGRKPVMVATTGRRGSAALMTSPDAEPGYLGLVPAGAVIPNYVAARLVFGIMGYAPGRQAAAVNCPILFCVCEADSVAPAKTTLRHASKAPRGEIRLYREGHFDIYNGAPFERVIADQIAFLQRHVPVASATPVIGVAAA
jgi:pimeloyl-ACP methyl ester carboxylesterase